MVPDLFADASHYRDAFALGLERLLENDQLGAFILVLANASYDEALWQRLWPRLNHRFQELGDELTEALHHGRRLDHPEDDLLVFLKLLVLGLNRVALTRHRHAGPWELQFNPARALRPARMSNAVVERLQAPFDEGGFHFNRPFLQAERIWEGELGDHTLRLFYNKFPFAPLHTLLVPEPEARRPQYLDRATHELAWRLLEEIGARLPGSGLGYNSRGAYASVNHLHLQFYSGKEEGYPIEDPRWRHNGGAEHWPLPVERFGSVKEAWQRIETLHAANCAYNLLYRPGRLYLTPRTLQGSYRHSDWTGGFAWAEVAGCITLSCEADFEALGETEIARELARLAPDLGRAGETREGAQSPSRSSAGS